MSFCCATTFWYTAYSASIWRANSSGELPTTIEPVSPSLAEPRRVPFGRIGREVVRRLLAFKCRVQVHDPVAPAADIRALGAEPVALDALFAQSDIVTLHCPSTPETRRLVNAERLAAMKPGALLVNLSRGDLVDTAALVAALEGGALAGAALDVFDPEPLPAEHPLRRLPQVIVAPHIASVSPNAVRALREGAARRAIAAVRGELPPNIVNGVTQVRSLAGG